MKAQRAKPQPAEPAQNPSVSSGENRHARFLARVCSLNSWVCTTEIPYSEGRVILHVTSGFIRLDVVAGHPAYPVHAYFLKISQKDIASHPLPFNRLKITRASRQNPPPGQIPTLQMPMTGRKPRTNRLLATVSC